MQGRIWNHKLWLNIPFRWSLQRKIGSLLGFLGHIQSKHRNNSQDTKIQTNHIMTIFSTNIHQSQLTVPAWVLLSITSGVLPCWIEEKVMFMSSAQVNCMSFGGLAETLLPLLWMQWHNFWRILSFAFVAWLWLLLEPWNNVLQFKYWGNKSTFDRSRTSESVNCNLEKSFKLLLLLLLLKVNIIVCYPFVLVINIYIFYTFLYIYIIFCVSLLFPQFK